MNEITYRTMQLPDTPDELAKFALVGREKLKAVKAEISAIEKVGLAKEVKDQKLKEAQAISEMVLDAEVRIGELMQAVPKATNSGANQYQAKSTAVSIKQKPKSEVIKEAGLKQHQVERFQTLAKHPEIVERAKAKAREKGEILTRQSILNAIAESKPPKPDPVKQAKKEHKEFVDNKQSGIVNFSDAKNDKDNQRILANALTQDILKLMNAVRDFANKHKDSDYDSISEFLDESERMLIRNQCASCKQVIEKIQLSMEG